MARGRSKPIGNAAILSAWLIIAVSYMQVDSPTAHFTAFAAKATLTVSHI
jgi:hypothetical protein